MLPTDKQYERDLQRDDVRGHRAPIALSGHRFAKVLPHIVDRARNAVLRQPTLGEFRAAGIGEIHAPTVFNGIGEENGGFTLRFA